MFRAIILPIFRSTRLCVTACGTMHRYNAGRGGTPLPSYRPATSCITPQAVTHSLVLLKMGKIICRNMLSWLELLINRYCCIWLVVYIIYLSDQSSRPKTPSSLCDWAVDMSFRPVTFWAGSQSYYLFNNVSSSAKCDVSVKREGAVL